MEVALCLPVIVLLAFATVEICASLFLRQTLVVAAYEGARAAVQRRGSPADATAAAQNILTARGIKGAKVTITPASFASLKALDPVAITVSAPVRGNSPFVGRFMNGRNLESKVTMLRGYND